MAGFISERWPASFRYRGRHQIGIGGRIASEFADVFERDIVMQDGRVYRTKMRKVPGAAGRYEVIAREEIEGASPDLGTKQD